MPSRDVLIVGGGIIGCAIAWRLAGDGLAVTLVDRGQVGGEATSASAGLLVPDVRDYVPPALLAFYLDSLARYDSMVAAVTEEVGAGVEYRRVGRLNVALEPEAVPGLERDLALNREAGVKVEWWSADDVRRAEPAVNSKVCGGLYFPDHRILDPGRLTHLLALAAEKLGARIVTGQTVAGLATDGDRVVGVKIGGTDEVLHGRYVVLAAGAWSGNLDPRVKLPVVPVKGQMIAFETGVPPVHHIVSGGRGSANPRADGRTTFGASTDFVGYDKSIAASTLADLLASAFELVPSLRQARFSSTWTGLRPGCPVDRLPLIGWGPLENLLVATGHWGMGILSAPATAEAIHGLIARGESPVEIAPFSPLRFG